MNDVDKKIAEVLTLTKETSRVVSKANPVFVLASLLQESVNLNQQWAKTTGDLVEAITNERKAKSPVTDG
jgi:hypothetical protein